MHYTAPTLLLTLLLACGRQDAELAARDAAAPPLPSSAAATPAAVPSAAAPTAECNEIFAKLESLGIVMVGMVKDGFLARCAQEPAAMRACWKAAATKDAADACDQLSTEIPKPPPQPSPAAVPLVDHDLSAGGPTWKGWSAKGPKDAKVVASGDEVGLTTEGPGLFGVWFRQRGGSLEAGKMGVESSKHSLGVKNTITVDQADKLEWVLESIGRKSYFFMWVRKVGKTDVTCTGDSIVGSSSPAQFAQVKESCSSLRKQ